MWERVDDPELPPEIAAVTTSVWLYPEVAQIGVMRRMMMAPPYLWCQIINRGVKNVMKAPGILTDLQQELYMPEVYAEAELDQPRNQALLLYLGFREIPSQDARKHYVRSI